MVATADPATLPDKATWYLVTNLPRPGGPREPGSPHPAAGLAEIVRIYGIQVRSDTAIHRHQTLVNCAFSFCWDAWFADPVRPATPPALHAGNRERGPDPPGRPARHRPGPGRSAPCAPGSPPGSRCSAGGPHGRMRPRHAARREARRRN